MFPPPPKAFFKKVLPNTEVITLGLREHKDEKVDPVNAILIEDSLHNFRRWNIAKGVSVLLLKGDYIYDYPDEEKITFAERENIVEDIRDFENTENVKRLLNERRSLMKTLKREDRTRDKYIKMLMKTRHN